MKELSIEQKAKRYDEAYKKVAVRFGSNVADEIFLKESEDERIRKEMIEILKNEAHEFPESVIANKSNSWIAWLEKQGEQKLADIDNKFLRMRETKPANIVEFLDRLTTVEQEFLWGHIEKVKKIDREEREQKPADKVEQKFKVGDWVVYDHRTYQIVELPQGRLINASLSRNGKTEQVPLPYCEKWSIQDAKNGDVLSYVTDKEDLWIMIYESLYKPYEGHVHYYAILVNNNFSDEGTCCISIDNLKPATKEQRELLFQKMKEAGYEWDAELKQLKKIEQNPIKVPKFKVGDFIQFNGMGHFRYTIKDVCGLSHYINSFDRRMDMAYTDANFELVEQKPAETKKGAKGNAREIPNSAWSEEDEDIINKILCICDDFEKSFDISPVSTKVIKEDVNKIDNWLKSLKDRVQPKQEWSEEDEKQLNEILLDIECSRAIHLHSPKGTFDSRKNWLKSIKERVQLQNIAYYNPYKEVVESIAKMCQHYDNMDVGSLQDFYDNVKVKCKDVKEYDSLFPQNTWKPNLAQLNALSIVSKGNAPDDIEAIVSLYNDLKKLREG